MEMGNTLVSLSLGFVSVLQTKIECITSIPWKNISALIISCVS